MYFRILSSDHEILAAKKLIYKVYNQQLNWQPEDQNPSGFKIIHDKEGNYFEDNFSQNSVYGAIFDNEKMLAVARIFFPIDNNLEFQLYKSIPLNYRSKNDVEINRVAIDVLDDKKRVQVLSFLIFSFFDYCQNLNIDNIFTTLSFPEPGNLALKLGFEMITNGNFKYSEKDLRSVEILYFDLKDEVKLLKFRNICESVFSV